MKTKALALTTILVILAAVSNLFANTISYGNLIGTTVKFLDVSETSMTPGDTAPLFGTPNLVGDSLVFTRMTFRSSASNGASDITDGKLDGTISAKNPFTHYIDKLKFQEFGDVTLTGAGTVNTKASVGCSIFVTILDVDDSSLLFPEFITVNMTMSQNGDWDIANDGTFTGKLWNGVLNLDLSTTLAQRGITGRATLLTFSIDNTLATQSETGTYAYIAKKAAGLQVTPEIIPEPATLLILGLGSWVVRRK